MPVGWRPLWGFLDSISFQREVGERLQLLASEGQLPKLDRRVEIYDQSGSERKQGSSDMTYGSSEPRWRLQTMRVKMWLEPEGVAGGQASFGSGWRLAAAHPFHYQCEQVSKRCLRKTLKDFN